MTLPNPPGHQVVAPGQIVASNWGNAAWDQTINRYASTADRDTQWTAPPDGAACYTNAEKTHWLRTAGAWRALSADSAPLGTPLWGTASGRPVKRISGYWEGALNGSSAVVLPLNTGAPWTALLDVQLTGRFQYQVANWENTVGMLNIPGCNGTSTGGQIVVTGVSPVNGAGTPNKFTGYAWAVDYQD